MQTIAIISQKGGGGKTTIATSLAVVAEAAGRAVLIVDTDPQASACRWGDRRQAETPAIIDAQPSRLAAALAKAEQAGFKLAIIDTPARVEQAAAESARAADLVIIPCRPGIADIETLRTTAELLRGRSERPALVVLNAVPATGSRSEQAASAIRDLGFELCSVSVGQRVAFEYAAQAGLGVTEYEPGGRAASEVLQLYNTICRSVRQLDE